MRRHRFLALVVGALLLPSTALAQTRVSAPTNKHNLSTTGPGPVKSSVVTEVCIFCHTPHNSNPAAPLWNQALSSGVTYQPYTSTTMRAIGGVPTGSSKLCMSCHDGTVAIGTTASNGRISGMQGVSAGGQLTGASVIGPNLTRDHPISFVPVAASDLVTPPAGSPVKLDGNGQVQCRTCHDPHQMDIDATTKKFLVVNNSGSGLCIVCHNKQYWASNPSTHMTSTKAYTAAQGAHTGYTTVATNGCESCHKPHNASPTAQRGLPQMALKAPEERTCGSGGSQCHSSSGVGRNIESEFLKTYKHPTYTVTPSVHDASESPTNPLFTLPETSSAAARHAECEDCHNPHASYALTASAPKGSGKVAGVWGINSSGSQVLPSGIPVSVNEYEICYKCHADSANLPQPGGAPYPPYPNRVLPAWNKRTQFDPTNVTFHPVAGTSKATAGASLIAPLTLSSYISCTDCHDNDTGPNAPTPGTGPSGPHGSQWKHLLAGRYDMDNSNTSEAGGAAYTLCYKCHDRTIIKTSSSWSEHNRHIGPDVNSSCSICHDPHGVSGGTTANNGHLINFDLRFVTLKTGLPAFVQTSTRRGYCNLTCHGKSHSNNENY